MRPIRIELEGFTAFRVRTVVDFEGADLFVFSGPTGSGKSSLIDAITFALYGSIARYDDTRLVSPVISQGLQEARVRFDFELHTKKFAAVRVVRLQKKGETWNAVTREARLESGGKVLAGTVKELDEQVARLFGLSFEQFTTCVVLPQGEFANFLHSAPKDRQGILRELLGIRLYGIMGQLARQRAQNAEQEMKLLTSRLSTLGEMSPARRDELEKRVSTLKTLRVATTAIVDELAALNREKEEVLRTASEIQETIRSLGNVKQPAGIDTLLDDHRKAETDASKAAKDRSAAESLATKEETTFEKLPDKTKIQQALDAHGELTERETELAELREVLERAEENEKKGAQSLQAAVNTLEQAVESLDNAKRLHAAQDIARGLHVGDTCPVCLQTVEKLPRHQKTGHLATLEKTRAEAQKLKQDAEKKFQAAASEKDGYKGRGKQIEAAIGKLRLRLKKEPPASDLRKQMKEIDAAEVRRDTARQKAEAARKTERQVNERISQVEKRVRGAWDDYGRVRDAVAKLGPPVPDRDDLGGSWKTFVAWRDELRRDALNKAEQLTATLKEVTATAGKKGASIIALCADQGVDVEDAQHAAEEIRDAIARAEEQIKEIDRSLREMKGIQKKLDEQTHARTIAHALSQHLRVDGFERWILQEAFERLREGGSRKLEELSAGDYSFQLNDQLNFDIVDHRNADEVRSVRTLSGGETFLASLALALTLAEQVAEMATEGAARLDSIFLDEGFGALDSEALELVASALEELGSHGRVVGLVTHVKELAERIPVQFRVTKTRNSSTVERVAV